MNILISGYGKMGRLIESRALEKGHSIVSVVDPLFDKPTTNFGSAVFASTEDAIKNVKGNCIAIDFTHPSVVFDNIKIFASYKIPVVVGTTGWYEKLEEAEAMVKANNTSMLWATNFSIGVNLFFKVAGYTAKIINTFEEYDASGYEIHHNQKADSPSGTAKTIVEVVLENMPRKKNPVYDKLNRPPEKDEIHFASIRNGSNPGTHALLFDSEADTIEIKHTVRSRDGLVSGAIRAAEWLNEKNESGVSGIFTINNVLED